MSVLLGFLLAGLIWLLSPYLAGFFRMPELTPVLRALGWIFPFSGSSVMAESLLQRELHFRWLAGIQVVSYAVGYGIVGVSLASLGYGVWALVNANLALPIRCVASLCHSTTHGATAGRSTLRGEWTSQSSSRRYDDEN